MSLSSSWFLFAGQPLKLGAFDNSPVVMAADDPGRHAGDGDIGTVGHFRKACRLRQNAEARISGRRL
ncbi:UNVERIFIED_ORG: hypothetical protein GGE53_005731 [Rhizobium etli]